MSREQEILNAKNAVIDDENNRRKLKYAQDLNNAAAAVRDIGVRGTELQENLSNLLAERMTFTDKNGVQRTVEGKHNDPARGTLGTLDVFATEEYKGHPFNEVSRNMFNHFKMYCLVNGISDEVMLTLARPNPPQNSLTQIRALKESFFRMVADKDFAAISRYYADIAMYAEAKLPGLLSCDDISRFRDNADSMILLQGSSSYLQQTLDLGAEGAGTTEDQKSIVREANRILSERGKNYTLKDIDDSIYPTSYIADTMTGGKKNEKLRLNLTYNEIANPDFIDSDQPHEATYSVAFKLVTSSEIIRRQKKAMVQEDGSVKPAYTDAWIELQTRNDDNFTEEVKSVLVGNDAYYSSLKFSSLSQELAGNEVHGFFGKKDNPPEYDELVGAANKAAEAEAEIERLKASGEVITIAALESLEKAQKDVQEKADTYLQKFEPGSGDMAKRFRLVAKTSAFAEKSISNLIGSAEYTVIREGQEHASSVLKEAAETSRLRDRLNSNLTTILEEPYTHLTTIGNERHFLQIVGRYNDPANGTYGFMEVFDLPEYKGKPFIEASRNMPDHFKAYCISRGMSEKQLMELAGGPVSEEMKKQLRSWKKDFFDMIIDKDLEKISDMYVSLAHQVEADEARFASLKPGNSTAIRNNTAFLLKYAGEQSWYSQSINHDGADETEEARKMVSLVDSKLLREGKSYGFGNLRAPLDAVGPIANSKFTAPAKDITSENHAGIYYGLLASHQAAMLDFMYSPDVSKPGRSWLSRMPEKVSDYTPVINAHSSPAVEKVFSEEKSYAEVSYTPSVLPEQPVAKDNVIAEEDDELWETVSDIEDVLGDQKIYVKIFQTAGIPYPAREALNSATTGTGLETHNNAKAFLEKRAAENKAFTDSHDIVDKRFQRLAMYFADRSNTPEAEEANRKFTEEINTPDGAAAFTNRIIKTLIDTDVSELLPSSLEDMARKYMENPDKYDLLWAAADLINEKNGLTSVEEPFLSVLTEKIPMLQISGTFSQAADLMASDGWAAFSQTGLTPEQLQNLAVAVTVLTPEIAESGAADVKSFSELSGSLLKRSAAVDEGVFLKEMNEKGLLKDNGTLVLEDKKYSRADALKKLTAKEAKADDVGFIPNIPEETDRLKRLTSDLPTTVQDLSDLKDYKAIYDFHKEAFYTAGVKLPTPAELRKIMSKPEEAQLHNAAKSLAIRHDSDINRLKNQFSAYPGFGMDRIYSYMLDSSGTTEAVEKNKQLMDSISTTEGKKLFAGHIVKLLMDQPDDFFLPKSIQDAARKYVNNPAIYDIAWVANDFIEGLQKPDSPLKLEEPLLSAFKARLPLFQQGAAFKFCAGMMARDDYGVFSIDFNNEQNYTGLALMYGGKDPYKVGEYNFANLVGAIPEGIRQAIKCGNLSQEQKHGLFSKSSELTINHKPVSINDAMKHIDSIGISGIEFRADEEKTKKINAQLKSLKTDYMTAAVTSDMLRHGDTRVKATAGDALRREMQAVYNNLDSVNHGAFISTKKFDNVLKSVKDLATNKHTPEEVELALRNTVKNADIYVANKTKGGNRLNQREKDRLKAVKEARQECYDRLKLMETRHRAAEAAHSAFFSSPIKGRAVPADKAQVKTATQLYDEATSRMEAGPERRAREIFAKYRGTPEQRELIDSFIPTLTEGKILERIKDPKIMTLHERARKVSKAAAPFFSVFDAEKSLGAGDSDMYRIMQLFMDYSGTPEAEEHNRVIAAAITTREGCSALYSRMVYQLVTSPVLNEMMGASTPEELLTVYEKDPRVCAWAFMSQEIKSFEATLKEPLKTAFLDRKNAIQIASTAGAAVKYMASDAFLAYPDHEISYEQYDYYSALSETIGNVNPAEKGMSKEIVFLASNLSTAPVFRKMGEKGWLSCQYSFTDKNGKHLNLSQAAEKIYKKEKVQGHRLSLEDQEMLQSQLSAMDVSEPLNIGRDVLNGKQAGVNGTATPEGFRAQISAMADSLKEVSTKHPGEESPELNKAAEILQTAANAHPQSLDAISEQYLAISEKFSKLSDETSGKTPIGDSMRSVLFDLSAGAKRASNLAMNTKKHRSHMEDTAFKRDNGIKHFTDNYLTTESEGPQILKGLAAAGLAELENSDGMRFEKLSEDRKQVIGRGIVSALLLNRVRMETVQGLDKKIGSVTDILTKNPDPVESIVSSMAKSPEIRKYCGIMAGNSETAKNVLTSPQRMNGMLSDYTKAHSIQGFIEEYTANEKAAQERRQAEEQRQAELREENAAYGAYYSRSAREAYVNQQKLLGHMLNNPLEYVTVKGPKEGATRVKEFLTKLRPCISTMIAAKQIQEFVYDNHEALGESNIKLLCSNENIKNRADMISKSETFERMMSLNSVLMKKNALFKLAIGTEKLLDPKAENVDAPTEQSEAFISEVTKRYSEMEKKVLPLKVTDYPQKQNGGMVR